MYIMNNSNCSNYPPNNFTLGKLLVQKSTYGIRQIFFNDNSSTTYIRNYNNGWTSWEKLYPDYSSKSFTSQGYIAFTNGLILQFGYSSSTGSGETHAFPIKFPATYIFMSCTWNAYASVNYWACHITVDLSTYKLYCFDNSTRALNWFVVGY